MNKHKGNSIKKVRKKIASRKQNKKITEKWSRLTQLAFITWARWWTETKTQNKKNDENHIKNANPNPNRENRENRAIENFYFFTKSCQHFFIIQNSNSWRGKMKNPVPFFLFMGHCTVATWKPKKRKNYIKQRELSNHDPVF